MADLASTRVFGKLTVMHEAIVKANAEIVGDITASKFIGDGSGLTGTASLRATGTTKGDVGLSGIPNTNGSTANFLRGDGTWTTPPNTNTTYSEITTAEIDAGTASTLRTISGRRMKYALDKKADTSTQVIAGTGLSGGGTLAANRTLSVNYGTAAGTAAQGNDSRLSNSREWTASAVTQAEAEAGTATTARKWTTQRVRQAILGWWNSSSDKTKLDGIAAGAQVNVATNLGSSGTGATRTITSSTGSNTSITYSAADVGAVPTARTITAGDGLSGGGTLAANRTISVDGTVVRTSGNQSIVGNKEFSTGFFGGIATSYGNLSSLVSGGTSAGDMVTGLRVVNTGTSAGTKARVLFTLTTNAAWENVSLEADRYSGSNMRFNIGIGDGANPPANIAQFYSDRAEINGNLILGEQGTTTAQAVRADRTITAGTGLSGGGNLTANRTLSVNYGTAAGTAAQGNDSRIVNAVPNTRTITAGTGLSGGGTLAANRTLSVSFGTAAGTVKEGNWQPSVATKAQVLSGNASNYVTGSSYVDTIAWNRTAHSSGTVPINLNTSLNHILNITGNVTIGAPSNATPGKTGDIVLGLYANVVVGWATQWNFLGSIPNMGANGEVWVVSYKVLSSTEILASAAKVV